MCNISKLYDSFAVDVFASVHKFTSLRSDLVEREVIAIAPYFISVEARDIWWWELHVIRFISVWLRGMDSILACVGPRLFARCTAV